MKNEKLDSVFTKLKGIQLEFSQPFELFIKYNQKYADIFKVIQKNDQYKRPYQSLKDSIESIELPDPEFKENARIKVFFLEISGPVRITSPNIIKIEDLEIFLDAIGFRLMSCYEYLSACINVDFVNYATDLHAASWALGDYQKKKIIGISNGGISLLRNADRFTEKLPPLGCHYFLIVQKQKVHYINDSDDWQNIGRL